MNDISFIMFFNLLYKPYHGKTMYPFLPFILHLLKSRDTLEMYFSWHPRYKRGRLIEYFL